MNNLKPDEALLSNDISLTEMELPIAILMHKNNEFSYVKVTDAYVNELHSIGFKDLDDAAAFFNNQDAGVYGKFYEYMKLCLKTGNAETKEFIARDSYCSIRMRWEPEHDNSGVVIGKAFLMNLSKMGQGSGAMDVALRSLYSFYDHINLANLKELTIKRLYTNSGKYIIESEKDSSLEYIEKYANKYIHPSERAKYREYFAVENIEKNFARAKKNFILTYFRTLNVDGEYEWKAYILLKALNGQDEYLYSCVRDVDVTTEHILIQDNYIDLFNNMPLPYSIFQVETTEDNSVADIICIYASNMVAELMGVPIERIIGRSILDNIEDKELWTSSFYDAAYNGKKINDIHYDSKSKKWVNIILSQAAEKGRCAVILEDVTKERMTTMRLGREWRTDDLIITCAKYLHCGLPYNDAINRVISVVGESVHAKRVYIIEANGDGTFTETFEWCMPGADSVRNRFINLTRADMINWEDEFLGAFSIIINDVEKIKDSHSRMYSILKKFGVKSIIEIPITDEGQLIGYFGTIDYREIDAVDVRQLLETLSYFLSAEIVRRKLLNELEKKSIYDSLCNVRNRNAMELVAGKLKNKNVPVGVLYADANGLKKLNDECGHEAGDALLRKMSRMMGECFGKDNVYRAGGDEFIVIFPKVSKEIFYAKSNELKDMFERENDMTVAVGCSWTENSDNINDIMRSADKEMYEDKANYYRKNNRRKPR